MSCSRRLCTSKFIGLSLAFLSFHSPKSYADKLVIYVASSYPHIRVSKEKKAAEKIICCGYETTCCEHKNCKIERHEFDFNKERFTREDLIDIGEKIGLDLRFVSVSRNDKIHKKISIKGVKCETDIPLQYMVVDCDRSKITKIELPNCIKTIDSMALAYLCALTEIEVPDQLLKIGNHAFAHSSNMDIQLPDTVKSVGNGAFLNCYSVKKIDCKEIESIGGSAFYSCEGLKEFNFSNVKSVGESAFGYSGLIKVKLGPKTSLSEKMFGGCKDLTSVEFSKEYNNDEENLVSDIIPIGCFANCQSLIGIKLPKGIKYIDKFAFSSCMSMNICDLSLCFDTLTEIREYAFNRCYSLIYLCDLKKSKGAMPNFNADILTRRNLDDATRNLDEEPMKTIITKAKHCVNLLLNPKAFNALED